MKFILGAYPGSPAWVDWSEKAECGYMDEILKINGLYGLELPFVGPEHPYNEWIKRSIDFNKSYVITSIPGVMNELKKNQNFGLASDSQQGRGLALEYYKSLHDLVFMINSKEKVIETILVHSAPGSGRSSTSKQAFYRSLVELSSWDWAGAKLAVEHCDAYEDGCTYQKGFLSLSEELEALIDMRSDNFTSVGVFINWGRSVIEKRSIAAPIEHLTQVGDAGLLRGLMFSGISLGSKLYPDWEDVHVPPSYSQRTFVGCDHSLLNEMQIQRCIDLACNYSTCEYIGAKLSVRPESLGLEYRLRVYEDACSFMLSLLRGR